MNDRKQTSAPTGDKSSGDDTTDDATDDQMSAGYTMLGPGQRAQLGGTIATVVSGP